MVISQSSLGVKLDIRTFSYGKQSLRSAVSTVDPFFCPILSNSTVPLLNVFPELSIRSFSLPKVERSARPGKNKEVGHHVKNALRCNGSKGFRIYGTV